MAAPGSSWLVYANYAYTRATFQSTERIFSARADDEVLGSSQLSGENVAEPGDRLPMIPAHQMKLGASYDSLEGASFGFDGQFLGEQWFRGDEANEETPLNGYFVANGWVALRMGAWEARAIVHNLLDSGEGIFGTFNLNRRSGELERFLTPLNGRSLRFMLERSLGS
jgi:outer membrane receptor protein involved in Fe transport